MKAVFGVVLRSYAAQRAMVAVVMFSSLLAGAAVIDQEEYAGILLIMFLAKFLNILNFGATSGFFVSFYGRVGMLKNSDCDSKVQYSLFVATHMLFIACLGILLSVFFFHQYIQGLLAFTIFIPIYSVEPSFRLERKFYLSLVPDLLLSIALCGAIALVFFDRIAMDVNVRDIYMSALLVSSVLYYLVLIIRSEVTLNTIRRNMAFISSRYLNLVRLGMPVYLGSALFMLASGMDRFLMPIHISQSEQATYLLSYQLATGAMIFLTSTNFVNTIDLGEAHIADQVSGVDLLLRKLRISVFLVLLSLGGLLFGVFVAKSYFLDGYEDLAIITMTLGCGLAVFHAAGALTPVLAYHRKQVLMTICMGLVAMAVLVNNLFSMIQGFGIVWLSAFTASMLFIYGLIAIAYTFRVAKTQENA